MDDNVDHEAVIRRFLDESMSSPEIRARVNVFLGHLGEIIARMNKAEAERNDAIISHEKTMKILARRDKELNRARTFALSLYGAFAQFPEVNAAFVRTLADAAILDEPEEQ